jgi:hypothetical protein
MADIVPEVIVVIEREGGEPEAEQPESDETE